MSGITSRLIPFVRGEHIEKALTLIMQDALPKQVEAKGSGAFASYHETLGVIMEEYHEYIEAVHKNDENQAAKELIDLAVAAIWGLASCLADDIEVS